MTAPAVEPVLRALLRHLDVEGFAAEVQRLAPPRAEEAVAERAPAPASEGTFMDTKAVLTKVVLADLLDDSILGARPDDHAFPLRAFFGLLGQQTEDDLPFSLACGLNFYFRAPMADEERALVGVEASRLFYRFAETEAFEPGLRERVAPLLAELLSTELSRLQLVSIDHDRIFDSTRHERDPRAQASGARILRPTSFACLVAANGNVRTKARVLT